ncbi:SHD1 domain-containing protein [Pontiellaceae bacterium B12219]|nr:SHD1 domain-containing protein [Pontiellaceae bacterium B12219]
MKLMPVILFLSFTLPVLAEVRTWTAKNGKTVEAEFVLRGMKSVRLKTDAGKILNVPFDGLSRDDQVYAELQSPPSLSVEVDPNENHVGHSVNRRNNEGYLILDFEITIRKKSRMSYSRPLKTNLYVVGVQEVSGAYIILQHHTSRVLFNEKRNSQTIKVSQLVLPQTQADLLTESEYEGYVLTITDERGEKIGVHSNRKAFESRPDFFSALKTGSIFSRSDLQGAPK